MHYTTDAIDVDRQPIENHSPEKSIYFVAFLVIASFFVLNMFIGIVVESFQNCQEKLEQELDQRRQEQLEQQRADKRRFRDDLAIYSQYPRWRQQIYDVCINKYFDLIIAAVIVINVATMSFEYYQMPRVRRFSCSIHLMKNLSIDVGNLSRIFKLFLYFGIYR